MADDMDNRRFLNRIEKMILLMDADNEMQNLLRYLHVLSFIFLVSCSHVVTAARALQSHVVRDKNVTSASKPGNTFPREVAQVMPALNLLKEKDVKRVAEIFLTNLGVEGGQLGEYVEIAFDKWLAINKMYKGDAFAEPNNLPCKIRKIVPPNNDNTSTDMDNRFVYGEFAFACENQNKEVLGYIAYSYENSRRWVYVSEVWVHRECRKKAGKPYHIAQELVEKFRNEIEKEGNVKRVYVDAIHKGSESLFQNIGFTRVSQDSEMWEKIYTPEYNDLKDTWTEISEIRGSANNEIICKVRIQNPVVTSKTADKIEDLMRLYPKVYRMGFRAFSFRNYYFRRVLVCEKEETGEYLAYIGYEDSHALLNEISADEMTIVHFIVHDKYIDEIGNKFLLIWEGQMKKAGKVKKIIMRKNKKEEFNQLVEQIGFTQKNRNILEKVYGKEIQEDIRAEDRSLFGKNVSIQVIRGLFRNQKAESLWCLIFIVCTIPTLKLFPEMPLDAMNREEANTEDEQNQDDESESESEDEENEQDEV